MRTATGQIQPAIRITLLLEISALACVGLVAQKTQPGAPLFSPPPVWPGPDRLTPALEHQYVFLNQARDAIIVRVPPDSAWARDGKPAIISYELHNRLKPSVLTRMTAISSGRYAFDYTIANARSARDNIQTWRVVIPGSGERPEVTSSNRWPGTSTRLAVFRNVELTDEPKGAVAVWLQDEADKQVAPGGSQPGFRIVSSCEPGFTTALFGSGRLVSFDQDLPEEIFEQLRLYDAAWHYVPTLAFGPMFCPGARRSEIVRNMNSGIRRAIALSKIHPDSEFVRDALAELRAPGVDDESKTPVLAHAPSNEFEQEIFAALRLSLSFRIGRR